MNIIIHHGFDDAVRPEPQPVAHLPALDWAWHVQQLMTVRFEAARCRICESAAPTPGRTICIDCARKQSRESWHRRERARKEAQCA